MLGLCIAAEWLIFMDRTERIWMITCWSFYGALILPPACLLVLHEIACVVGGWSELGQGDEANSVARGGGELDFGPLPLLWPWSANGHFPPWSNSSCRAHHTSTVHEGYGGEAWMLPPALWSIWMASPQPMWYFTNQKSKPQTNHKPKLCGMGLKSCRICHVVEFYIVKL